MYAQYALHTAYIEVICWCIRLVYCVDILVLVMFIKYPYIYTYIYIGEQKILKRCYNSVIRMPQKGLQLVADIQCDAATSQIHMCSYATKWTRDVIALCLYCFLPLCSVSNYSGTSIIWSSTSQHCLAALKRWLEYNLPV